MYRQLDQVSVTYLRAGFFYTNFYNDVPMIKTAGIMGSNYPANIAMPLVHPADIAAAAAEELVKKADGHHVRYIISDIRSPREVAGILGAAVGKPELSWAEFSDEQSLQGMVQAGVPEEIAGLYTEMGAGFRKGIVAADFQKNGAPITGPTKLEAFAQEFAEVF